MTARRWRLVVMSVAVLAVCAGGIGADCDDAGEAAGAGIRGRSPSATSPALIETAGAALNADQPGATVGPDHVTVQMAGIVDPRTSVNEVVIPVGAGAPIHASSATSTRSRANRNLEVSLANGAANNDFAIWTAALLARAQANNAMNRQLSDQPVTLLDGCDSIVPNAVLRANIIGSFEPASVQMEVGSILRFEPDGLTGMRSNSGLFQTNNGEVSCLYFSQAGVYPFDASTNELAKGVVTVE